VDRQWNGTRALELTERARVLRRSTVVDSAFRAYEADARGFVYFFIDRPDSEDRTLVKADQIALDIFWQAPNLTKQRIVGLRDEKVLPTNIRYHLDHLTVVQDDFGDYIRMGAGDEVSRVLHPLGPRSENLYDFQLADSLTLSYGSGNEEVRVYEVRVRPKRLDQPGFVGSVFLDRATAAIVRMSFTFTSVSYVDPYLDYIRVSLDNALWMGRYWLPYRQEVELRREMPALDFLAGSIIRGRFEISAYDFNTVLPPSFFAGPTVTALPQAQRERFPFERGLFHDLDEEGLATTPSMAEIRAQAVELAGSRYLTGLSRWRLHLRSVSDAVRYNRAEGLFLGGGIQLRPLNDVLLRTSAGYAFAAGDPSGRVFLTSERSAVVPTLEAYTHRLRDIGPLPGAAPFLGTMAAAFASEDYLDPFFARGVSFSVGPRRDRQAPTLRLRVERQTSATDAVSSVAGVDFRPVLPIDEGVLRALEVAAPFTLPWRGQGSLQGSVARLEDNTYRSLVGSLRWARNSADPGWKASVHLNAGATSGGAPAQALFLLGGRGTLPGYGYRSFVGDRYALLRAEATRALLRPWLGLRTFFSVGSTSLSAPVGLSGWSPTDSDGLRPSIGAGLALGWDVLRLDFGYGLRDGGWEVSVSVDPRFHPWL
jgi:hypothetical protein